MASPLLQGEFDCFPYYLYAFVTHFRHIIEAGAV